MSKFPISAAPAKDFDDSIDARILRAEAAIAGLKASFATWVKADIDLIGVHFSAAFATAAPAGRAGELEALRHIAHNIKGQAGTFGCHGLALAAAELDGLLLRRSDDLDAAAVGEFVAKLNRAFTRDLA